MWGFDCVKWRWTTFKLKTTNDLSYCHGKYKAKIIYLKVNKNLSTTTFTRLIVRVIVKTLYIAFFSPANFRFLLSCYCLLFVSFYHSFSTVQYTAYLLQQLTVAIKFSCKICNKAVANNHHAVECDKCHILVHIKCNKINLQTYNLLQKCPPALWRHCYFGTISNEELFKTNQGS